MKSNLVETLLATSTAIDLNRTMLALADKLSNGTYCSYLPVSFDYWHFGRHSEFARQYNMTDLSALFSMAWQHDLNIASASSPLMLEQLRGELRSKFPELCKITMNS